MNDKELCKKCIYYDDFCCRNSNAICVNNSEYTEEEKKIELTPHDLGAAFCNFNLHCFAPCAVCAAFVNGFCDGDPSAADLEKIGEEILIEWKGENC